MYADVYARGFQLTVTGRERARGRVDAPGGIDPRVLAAAKGDTKATESLVVELLPRVRNLVRYLVRGDQSVDDIAQDALVKVIERLPSFRGEGRFASWVDGIVLRVTLASQRKRARERQRSSLVPSEELPSREAPGERYLTRRRLVDRLDELPGKQRIAVVMHHVLGMSIAEIASELSIPTETVRSRIRHGVSHLRVRSCAGEGAP